LLGLVAVLFIVRIDLGISQHSHLRSESTSVPLFDNLGDHHHPITTSSPLAQRYFDQGLRLVYAFNDQEANRAFSEAARLDPQCAMAHWGIALAHGPNITNLVVGPEQERLASREIQQALALSTHATEIERAYIEALARRYSDKPGAEQKALQASYIEAMRDLTRRFPEDLDAAALLAEGLLAQCFGEHSSYWTFDGKPQPGIAEALSILEKVLQQNPNHPGANHFYIHALEASPYPEKALASAERITDLMPGAGHLVHMPSHIYIRVGRYWDAVESNRRALTVDSEYIKRTNASGIYPMMMVPHNFYFLWAALVMEGQSVEALGAARTLAATLTETMMRQMPMLEFYAPLPLFTLARFGRWSDILKEPSPQPTFPYLTGMWHYARGLAFAATGKPEQAITEKARLTAIARGFGSAMAPEKNLPANLLRLASAVLAGEVAARQGKTDEAIVLLKEAVKLQDQIPYYEPPPWYYPVRQSLGAALLTAGRAAEAERVYGEDLGKNPQNGWSLYGLAQSLRAQNKPAADVEEKFHKAWARADVALAASRF
jgi:tetratricopeptide (TPR) repeat protein